MAELVSVIDSAPSDWDDFVVRQEGGNYCHLSGWGDIIAAAYGHETQYLFTRVDGNLRGVMPLVHLRSKIFGSELVSMPYLDLGGPLCDGKGVLEDMVDGAIDFAGKRNTTLSIRCDIALGKGAIVQEERVQMHIPLAPDHEEMFSRLSSGRRNRIRKARKNGLSAEFGGLDCLDRFYRVYAHNMRDLGSPPHRKKFFREILDRLSGNTGVILVKDGSGNVIGAGLYVRFRDMYALPWVSSLKESFRLNPNLILYWEIMSLAIREGCTLFDFGRSTKGTGTYEFKRQWGAHEVPLLWHFWGRGAEKIGERRKEGTGYALMVEMWKRLPVPLSTRLAYFVRGSISL